MRYLFICFPIARLRHVGRFRDGVMASALWSCCQVFQCGGGCISLYQKTIVEHMFCFLVCIASLSMFFFVLYFVCVSSLFTREYRPGTLPDGYIAKFVRMSSRFDTDYLVAFVSSDFASIIILFRQVVGLSGNHGTSLTSCCNFYGSQG